MAIRHEISVYGNVNKCVGVYDIIEWVSTDWGGPDKPGWYLVADGKGSTKTLFTTGDTNRMKDVLFDGRWNSILWANGHGPLNDSELVQLAMNGFQTWYNIESDYDCDGYCGEILTVFKKEDRPAYWLKGGQLTGPIDDELSSCPIHHTNKLGFHADRVHRYDENGHDTYDDIPLF